MMDNVQELNCMHALFESQAAEHIHSHMYQWTSGPNYSASGAYLIFGMLL
jgi:hypothetical protein